MPLAIEKWLAGMGDRGGFDRGFGGRGRGDRGRGRGRPRGNRKEEEEKWVPCTKLGRLVQQVCDFTSSSSSALMAEWLSLQDPNRAM